MTVWIVRREYNMPDADEAADTPILGVYATFTSAKARRDHEVARELRDGYIVYGEPAAAGDANEEDWYVDYHIDLWTVQTTGPYPPARPGRCGAICDDRYPCDKSRGHDGAHAYSESDYPPADTDGRRCGQCGEPVTAGDRTLGRCGQCQGTLPREDWL